MTCTHDTQGPAGTRKRRNQPHSAHIEDKKVTRNSILGWKPRALSSSRVLCDLKSLANNLNRFQAKSSRGDEIPVYRIRFSALALNTLSTDLSTILHLPFHTDAVCGVWILGSSRRGPHRRQNADLSPLTNVASQYKPIAKFDAARAAAAVAILQVEPHRLDGMTADRQFPRPPCAEGTC